MDPLSIALLVAIAFAPPVILVLRLRNAERHRPEPYRLLARAFLWGAVLAAALSILAQWGLSFVVGDATLFDPRLTVMIVLVAPLVEEAAKVVGLQLVDDDHLEPEDGYIYGGAVGLGFAATENAIYILLAFTLSGQETAMATALYRGVATVALHGAASAVAGHGLWRAWAEGSPRPAVYGIAAAVVLHVAYNALSALSLPWATLLAAGAAVVAYMRMMVRVRVLDERRPA